MEVRKFSSETFVGEAKVSLEQYDDGSWRASVLQVSDEEDGDVDENDAHLFILDTDEDEARAAYERLIALDLITGEILDELDFIYC